MAHSAARLRRAASGARSGSARKRRCRRANGGRAGLFGQHRVERAITAGDAERADQSTFGVDRHAAGADVRRRTATEHRSATNARRDVRRRHPEARRGAGPTRRRPTCRRVVVAHHRDDLARAIDEHERERLTATLRTKDYLYRAGAESIEEERVVGGVHEVGRVGGELAAAYAVIMPAKSSPATRLESPRGAGPKRHDFSDLSRSTGAASVNLGRAWRPRSGPTCARIGEKPLQACTFDYRNAPSR